MTVADAVDRLVPFDPTRPVDEGVTLLEASAGTGKTHAVASLVVAEVARGRPLDELLVVTFTRKATGTLRERVWQRLAAAVAALDPTGPSPDDPVHRYLAEGTPGEVAVRRARLSRALSDFDATTIATTHGFCQQVLVSLGVAGDAERDIELLEDVGELVEDAVDDLFVRRFHSGGEVPFDRDTAKRIAKAVVENPDAEIANVDRDLDADVQRRRFAITLGRRIVDQKRRGRLITYDDLLGRLDRSLADPVRGTLVAERLRRRFSMAVVDEFQDTDTVQWRILRKAFGTAPSRLVLVGDPKQAIYAFRGGDVHAYREATTQAAVTLGLGTSWRSDQALLDGLDAFLAGAQLGGPGIVHRPLRARPGAEAPRLLCADAGAPFTVRVVERRSGRIACTRYGFAEKSSTRRFIADDVAGEAVRLLNAGATLVERDVGGAASDPRPLGPGDLAVLVRSHRDAEGVRRALVAAGVPAIVHGGDEVMKTDAAQAWLDLLRALEQPSTARVRAAAAGSFFGWDAEHLATASDLEWDEVDERLHEWAAALRASGVTAVMHRIEAAVGLTARLLGVAGGERRLSDLRHVGELLHARHAAHPASAAGLAGWLDEQRISTTGGESARRRLESDAPSVTVQTIHGAKGLEFPVVLLPSLWEGPWADEKDPPIFHDDQGVRCIGVGSGGRVHQEQMAAAARERSEEELRLLYVAVTRARHRVVLWWATAHDAATSPFARILLGRDPVTGSVDEALRRVPTEDDVRLELASRSALCAGAIAVEEAGASVLERFVSVAPEPAALGVKPFGRTLDERWVRTSYSGLTAAAHDALAPVELAPIIPVPSSTSTTAGTSVASVISVISVVEAVEVDERAKVDEPALGTRVAAQDPLAAPVPLADVPGGARIGSLVHEILERTDFAAPDLEVALASAAAQAGAPRLLGAPADVLVAGLTAALSTPLGPLLGGRRLRDLSPADRLDELAFDLPLAGGDAPTGVVTMAAVADVFAAHLPADGLLAGYAERLRDPLLTAEVRGFLTGSIDLVARVDGRHVVIDYKTNRLAPPDRSLTAGHYRPEAMAAAMQDAHYPLQAAVYAVALHRYLRWRLAGYDPARHLGGAAYLFLRGMTGPDAPTFDGHPCGVFAWPMPVAFVTDLSDLFDRGVP